jgi:hypothetical protein
MHSQGGRWCRESFGLFYVHAWSKRPNMSVAKENLENRIVRHRDQQAFDHERALQRMHGDIIALRDFILWQSEGQNASEWIVANEFSFLDLIHEFQSTDLASGKLDDLDPRTHYDTSVTRQFIGDWRQLSEQDGKEVIYSNCFTWTKWPKVFNHRIQAEMFLVSLSRWWGEYTR